jgi:histidyl-tRNA synthetase
MVYEHEIPSGSKLYFGQSAKIKREIEFVSAELLENLGYEEIVTPLFSFHQHESFEDKKSLLRLGDEQNHEVTLRADSTVDVVRIVTKRLGRSMESKKWFYIQPTVTYPTHEQYQIGAEVIGGGFAEVTRTATLLLQEMEAMPLMQIANIRIPHILNEQYGVSLDALKSMHVEAILATNLPWIESLLRINSVEDLTDISMFPEVIQTELKRMKDATEQIKYEKMVISPLFYAKMRYYDSLTFRMFEGNSLLAMGGIYSVDGVEASGFALYTDECIAYKMDKGNENE